jgi:hypothetical protein
MYSRSRSVAEVYKELVKTLGPTPTMAAVEVTYFAPGFVSYSFLLDLAAWGI